MKVPFNDVRAIYRRLAPELDAATLRVLESGWYIGGPEVEEFERQFAAVVGAPYAAGVASGTDAIAIALRALGVGYGDHVIVPAASAYPTVVGVLQTDATPVFVDVTEDGLIDPALVAEIRDPAVKAVLPVHLYGNMADVERLAKLCRDRKLLLVEDCAQAHGASLQGRPAGAFGEAAAWSFYPTKNLGAFGDAGAVSCQDAAVAAKVKRLRNYGQSTRYEHAELGWNSRLDPIQAAILMVRLPHVADENARREAIAARYDQAFKNLGPLRPIEVPPGDRSSRHLYVVLLSKPEVRADFQTALGADGVETLVHYPITMPDQAASDPAWSGGRSFPVARSFCSRVVSLPLHPYLSEEQIEHVIAAVKRWARAA